MPNPAHYKRESSHERKKSPQFLISKEKKG